MLLYCSALLCVDDVPKLDVQFLFLSIIYRSDKLNAEVMNVLDETAAEGCLMSNKIKYLLTTASNEMCNSKCVVGGSIYTVTPGIYLRLSINKERLLLTIFIYK